MTRLFRICEREIAEISLQVTGASLKQVKFKHLGVVLVFISDERQDEELWMDIQMGILMRDLQYSVVMIMKRELSKQSQAPSFKNSFRLHSYLWS